MDLIFNSVILFSNFSKRFSGPMFPKTACSRRTSLFSLSSRACSNSTSIFYLKSYCSLQIGSNFSSTAYLMVSSAMKRLALCWVAANDIDSSVPCFFTRFFGLPDSIDLN